MTDVVALKIAGNMGKFLTRYGDYISNVSKTRNTLAQQNVLLYTSLGAVLELFRIDIANFFTTEQRDTLIRANDTYLSLLLSMPTLETEEEKEAHTTHTKINQLLNTPLTQKDNYKLAYNLSDAQMSMLREQAEQLFGDIFVVMDTNMSNIRNKKTNLTAYIGTKGSILPRIMRRLLPRTQGGGKTISTRMKQFLSRKPPISAEEIQINLKELQKLVNDLFTTTTGMLMNDTNPEGAKNSYNNLKNILLKLGKKNIYYTRARDVIDLGNIITARSSYDQQTARKLANGKQFKFDGKLFLVQQASQKQQQPTLATQAQKKPKQQQPTLAIQAQKKPKQQQPTLAIQAQKKQQQPTLVIQAQKKQTIKNMVDQKFKQFNLNQGIIKQKKNMAINKAIKNALNDIFGPGKEQLVQTLVQNRPDDFDKFKQTVVQNFIKNQAAAAS